MADHARTVSESVAMTELFDLVRVFGGTAKDIAAVTDTVSVEILKLGDDVAVTVDSLRAVAWYVRTTNDAIDVEDSAGAGELTFVPYGVDASVGPIAMYAIEDAGPLSISGGPELSTGPVGFVTRKGDFVSVTDQLIQGMSLAIEFVDSVEATG